MDSGALVIAAFGAGWIVGNLGRIIALGHRHGLRRARLQQRYHVAPVQSRGTYDPSSNVIVRGPAPYDWQQENRKWK